MKRPARLLTAALALALTIGAKPVVQVDQAVVNAGVDAGGAAGGTVGGLPASLSAFGFFDGGADNPAPSLIRYELTNPLFSDYAGKARFIHLPVGARLSVSDDGRVDFPVGSALIKSFGYAQAGGYQTLETRVLLRRADGWVALPYVWNNDGRDASLKLAGQRLPVRFTDPSGTVQTISYSVPNKNQCKQCHSRAGALVPIGPVWPDMIFPRSGDAEALHARTTLPDKPMAALARWDDVNAPIAKRAEGYLRANCAHCHGRDGAASNSGLFYDQPLRADIIAGVGKRPVAAGRGSAGLEFIIAPGKAEQSILIHRLRSLDPGIAMPEIGRASIHREGEALLSAWINSLPGE